MKTYTDKKCASGLSLRETREGQRSPRLCTAVCEARPLWSSARCDPRAVLPGLSLGTLRAVIHLVRHVSLAGTQRLEVQPWLVCP